MNSDLIGDTFDFICDITNVDRLKYFDLFGIQVVRAFEGFPKGIVESSAVTKGHLDIGCVIRTICVTLNGNNAA